MPIRFNCTGCGQRLGVGSRKAGQSVACPKCGTKLTIPEASDDAAIAAPPIARPDPPGDMISMSFDDEPDVVIETVLQSASSRGRREAEEGAVDEDRISLPRYVVYVQGALLAVVGVFAFLLGIAVGGAVTTPGAAVAKPCTISGTASIVAVGRRMPDGGATILFLPFDAVPDEKIPLIGMRPGDDPAAGERVKEMVRILGGVATRCGERGTFQVQLPKRGKYFLLAISSNWKGKPGEIAPTDLGQLGRFFDLSEDPLAERKIQWRPEAIRGDRKLNVDFD